MVKLEKSNIFEAYYNGDALPMHSTIWEKSARKQRTRQARAFTVRMREAVAISDIQAAATTLYVSQTY